ncbi:MAG TPA: SGNH/GDSL hydrolase family protein, partial [Candidatus Polarisedimenticolia bacterium]|nr:SGNH/GDSL hydrolase family protein [Candidatus Polarisedimenticolia bacterium]
MIRDRRSGGAIVHGLALVLASTFAALGLAEGMARLFLPPPERVAVKSAGDLDARLERENSDPQRLAYRGAVNALFIKTPTGRRLRASTEVTIENHALSHRTIVLRTNSLGFRGPEIGAKTRPRVLFLGDSITMGHYLPEEETFVSLVGRLSGEAGAPLETVNGGVGGIGLETELAILRETGLRVAPDTVVIGFYLNDVQQSPGVRIVQVPSCFSWSLLARYAAAAVPRFLARDDWEIPEAEMTGWLQEIRRRDPAGPGDPVESPGAFNALVQENYRDWGSAWSDGAWNRIDPLLAEFRRQADLNHFRLVIV